jgi:Kef-type K+ transport system membrane component KefB
MDPREIRGAGLRSCLLSIIAFSVPMVSGFFACQILGLPTIQSLFMGLLLSITAVPVSAVVLMEFGMLKTKLGTTVITAAVVNDILSLIVLSIIFQLNDPVTGGIINLNKIIDSIIKISAFIGGIFLVDMIFRKSSNWLPVRVAPFFQKLQTKEAAFGILLISTIVISLIAQSVIGLYFIIGTFFSGLIVYKEIIRKQNYERVYGVISAVTFGFFAPIFFANMGISINVGVLSQSIPLFAALLLVAVLSKVFAGYTGARILRFSKYESLTIAHLMNGRGMVELVIASIGFGSGLIDLNLFSIAVLIGFITTIMAPLFSRKYVLKIKSEMTNN